MLCLLNVTLHGFLNGFFRKSLTQITAFSSPSVTFLPKHNHDEKYKWKGFRCFHWRFHWYSIERIPVDEVGGTRWAKIAYSTCLWTCRGYQRTWWKPPKHVRNIPTSRTESGDRNQTPAPWCVQPLNPPRALIQRGHAVNTHFRHPWRLLRPDLSSLSSFKTPHSGSRCPREQTAQVQALLVAMETPILSTRLRVGFVQGHRFFIFIFIIQCYYLSGDVNIYK